MQHPTLPSDQELVNEYLHGKESSLEILIHRHKRRIFSSIYFLVRDKELTDDLFQDTFIKVINTLRAGNYNEEGKFLPWVMRIAHNLVIDHFRREKKMPKIRETEEFSIFDVISNGEENAQEKTARKQLHQQVRDLINGLPLEQKEVLIMRHYAEMSFQEIADATGVSINTALGRMRYALINLRKMMSKSAYAYDTNLYQYAK